MESKPLPGFGTGLVTRVNELIARLQAVLRWAQRRSVSENELIVRLQAVLRRAQRRSVSEEECPFNAGRLSVDFAHNKVLVGGKPVKLTSTERKLLYHLIKNEGRMLSHETLMAEMWGNRYMDPRDLLRVHIQHLRQKLEDDAESPNVIVAEHGMGYKFIKPVDAEMLKSQAMETLDTAVEIADHVKGFATETADKVKAAAAEVSGRGEAAVQQ